MKIFEMMAEREHEQLVFWSDPAIGYRGIIAVHDTTLGPALGGTRFWRYASEEEALVDRLTWRPVAETCIASLLHVICDQAEASAERTTRCTDAEVRALAKAKIEARRLGLSEADTQTAAGLTADLFCDRAQFVEPESLTIDGQQFTIHRDGDTLVVRAL